MLKDVVIFGDIVAERAKQNRGNMLMKTILKILFVMIVLSNFGFSHRSQTMTNRGHISIHDFERSIDQTYQEINEKRAFNAQNCDKYILSIGNFLLQKSSKRYLPLNQNDFEDLKERGDVIINKLFLLRLRLRDKFNKFYYQGDLTSECVKKMRMAFRYSRFIEEFITETLVAMDTNPVKADPYNFAQQKRQFFLNPKYKNFQFKSGDIIIVRTSSFVSAIISRIGDNDGQFSHAAMLYIDSKGNKQIIEALNSHGVVIKPFDEWRKNDRHARILLFRYRDESLARKSAQKLYALIHRRWELKDPILYDFKMIPKSDEFFCSELVQYGFRLGGESRIPTFPTSFYAFSNHTFLDDMTIEATRAFAPSDMEVEPLVDLVAEWRNYDITRDVRIEDVVQTKVLNWMSYRDYQLKGTLQSTLGASVGIMGRRYFGFNHKNVPINMPYGFMESIIKVYDIDKVLEKYLHKKEEKYFKKYQHSMDYLTMMKALETFRREDCERYIERKKEMNDRILHNMGDWAEPYKGADPLLHTLFNTKNGFECNKGHPHNNAL